MCELCLRFPCMAGCPNAEEPPVVTKCATCGRSIFEGEEMVEINGESYHVECLENITTRELLELFGCYTFTAGE